jgi:hypothetical protein
MVCELKIFFSSLAYIHQPLQQATMPNHASLLEQKQAKEQAYGRQYYLDKKDRYIANYERKRQATYTCASCHQTIKLVSKSAHEKTRKHLYAYYRSVQLQHFDSGAAAGSNQSAQSAEGEGEGELREEQGQDSSEGSSAEE